ncbi:hypothetical protein AOXY_G33932 [Acipenser oxyrinchus oxyrinchus]|uniref:Uncharacterized protein n=1 Tax=Acipenser oxyrinchus oxyrinchus TaxID=40147 RepID=A0AAD8FRI0_ACIOX|nr:hypothetical protein AOXY_G33932 [Acipenser oxyrinchus oxyrinchus]
MICMRVSHNRGKAQEQTEGASEDKEELERLRRENKELEAMYKEEKLRREELEETLRDLTPQGMDPQFETLATPTATRYFFQNGFQN